MSQELLQKEIDKIDEILARREAELELVVILALTAKKRLQAQLEALV